jgi:hypothetical protein
MSLDLYSVFCGSRADVDSWSRGQHNGTSATGCIGCGVPEAARHKPMCPVMFAACRQSVEARER